MTTDITKPADPPIDPAPASTPLPWWTRGDTNAFFGLATCTTHSSLADSPVAKTEPM